MQMFEKKMSNFCVLDNAIMQDASLSLEARGLYAYMVSLPNDWHFSFDRLATANNVGLYVIRRVIKELENAKLLQREVRAISKGEGVGKIAVYTLFDSITRGNYTTLQDSTFKNSTLKNTTIYKEINNTKKESNKEIINTSGDFEKSQKMTQPSKEKLSKKSSKENLLDYANDIYTAKENEGGALHFTKAQWLEWVDYKLKRQRNLTKRTLELNFKQLCDFGTNAYEAITNSIGCGYQGLFLPYNTQQQKKKPDYNPRTGNAGQSVFSDNPDDYINENMEGVTKIRDGIFEADLFKLTGRKS